MSLCQKSACSERVASVLLALLEATTKAAITAFDSDTAVPPLVQFAEMKARVTQFAALLGYWQGYRGQQVQSREARPSVPLPTTTAPELEQVLLTYKSLLCMSSIRSVKRTSRFLSQNPSMS